MRLMITQRFLNHISILPSGCWQWMGYVDRDGYGRFRCKQALGHRYVYEETYGGIPNGLEIDHLCRNRACVNPQHLETVTHEVNVKRGNYSQNGEMNRCKTHCPQGHPLDAKNTYHDKNGYRHCRLCASHSTLGNTLRYERQQAARVMFEVK